MGSAHHALVARCVQQLAGLAARRSFLQECCASVMLAALQPLKPKALAKVLAQAPAVMDFMAQPDCPEVRGKSCRLSTCLCTRHSFQI